MTISTLEELSEKAAVCMRCPLCETRTNVVFGSGDPQAAIVIIGEAPGQTEDESGVPFVGRAGQLLTTLLNEVGIDRAQAFITNVLMCRPPANRDPDPAEIEACSPYLARKLDLIQPNVVVTLGNFATKLLLGRNVGITRLRGQVYPFRGASLVPTYHPSALLRPGSAARMHEARSDFQLVAELLQKARAPGAVAAAGGGTASTGKDRPAGGQLGLF